MAATAAARVVVVRVAMRVVDTVKGATLGVQEVLWDLSTPSLGRTAVLVGTAEPVAAKCNLQSRRRCWPPGIWTSHIPDRIPRRPDTPSYSHFPESTASGARPLCGCTAPSIEASK